MKFLVLFAFIVNKYDQSTGKKGRVIEKFDFSRSRLLKLIHHNLSLKNRVFINLTSKHVMKFINLTKKIGIHG